MYISLVQVPITQQPWPSPPPQPLYNFSDKLMQKDGVGFGVNEEEKRRKKKSEEVLKIIKRACREGKRGRIVTEEKEKGA